jgi:hypothetical protein
MMRDLEGNVERWVEILFGGIFGIQKVTFLGGCRRSELDF